MNMDVQFVSNTMKTSFDKRSNKNIKLLLLLIVIHNKGSPQIEICLLNHSHYDCVVQIKLGYILKTFSLILFVSE